MHKDYHNIKCYDCESYPPPPFGGFVLGQGVTKSGCSPWFSVMITTECGPWISVTTNMHRPGFIANQKECDPDLVSFKTSTRRVKFTERVCIPGLNIT